jgi:hypothetical protein
MKNMATKILLINQAKQDYCDGGGSDSLKYSYRIVNAGMTNDSNIGFEDNKKEGGDHNENKGIPKNFIPSEVNNHKIEPDHIGKQNAQPNDNNILSQYYPSA